MKRSFIAGVIVGAIIFGVIGAVASGIVAAPNPFPILLNGENVSIDGYAIGGSTYLKLREMSSVLGGFEVDFQDDTILITTNKEEEKVDKLLYQGHGSFRLTLAGGEVIYIDPYAGEGYDQPADLILVTHQHPDHNQIGLVPQKDGCVVFQNSDAIVDGEYRSADIAGVHIEPVQAYNKNHDITQCVGYLVTVGDKLLYFAGDTSKTEQMAEMAKRGIDYAFLPMDGRFNMDIPEAIECAEIIQAKHTVPVHMSPGSLFDRSRAEQFVAPGALIVEAGEEIEL